MTAELFTAADTAVLLIDHQVGTMGWIRSADIDDVKTNALALARAAKALDLPLVLTSSLQDQAQGPLSPELESIAPEPDPPHRRRQCDGRPGPRGRGGSDRPAQPGHRRGHQRRVHRVPGPDDPGELIPS